MGYGINLFGHSPEFINKALDEQLKQSMAIGPQNALAGKIAELFTTPHSKSITWDHLLRQTSDWKGELWGKPDWADRPAADLEKELSRERYAPV